MLLCHFLEGPHAQCPGLSVHFLGRSLCSWTVTAHRMDTVRAPAWGYESTPPCLLGDGLWDRAAGLPQAGKGLWNLDGPGQDPCKADGKDILRTVQGRDLVWAGKCISVEQEFNRWASQLQLSSCLTVRMAYLHLGPHASHFLKLHICLTKILQKKGAASNFRGEIGN